MASWPGPGRAFNDDANNINHRISALILVSTRVFFPFPANQTIAVVCAVFCLCIRQSTAFGCGRVQVTHLPCDEATIELKIRFHFFPFIQSSSMLYELNTHIFVLVLIWSLAQFVGPRTTALIALRLRIECHDVAFVDVALHGRTKTHSFPPNFIHPRNSSCKHLIWLNIARRGSTYSTYSVANVWRLQYL